MQKVKFKFGFIGGVLLSCAVWTPWLQAASQEHVHSMDDSREVIWLSEAEKTVLLSEMRGFLEATQIILEASLANDMEMIEKAAREVGVKMMKATPKTLHDKLPSGFTKLGPKAHLGFEAIADEASGLGDREVVLEHLAELQKTCNGCHAMYRIEVK